MAKYIGTLTSDARGKVGGIVLTRARNGTNMKAHAVPVNPSSLLQVGMRGTLSAAVSAWRALDGSGMNSWNFFAGNYTWLNTLSQPYVPTGLQLWTQAYVNAKRFGTVPPSNWSGTLPVLKPITGLSLNGDGTFLIFLASDAFGYYASNWLLYCTRILPPTVNYVKHLSRRFIGPPSYTNEIIATTTYRAAFGSLPPSYSYLGFSAVGVDPVTFISASPYTSAGQVIP